MTLSGKELENMANQLGDADDFKSESWRVFRMMSEYVDGIHRLSDIHPAISFFGSARTRPGSDHYQFARKTARLLSESGFAIISGGGPGIMEAVNQGAQEGGSPSIGLNIDLPVSGGESNAFQDINLSFDNFSIRKLMFVQFASAYVAMPGGFGTLDEIVECVNLMQTHKARQIPVILAGKDFWSGLVDWLNETLLTQGMISTKDLSLFQVLDTAEDIRDVIIASYESSTLNP